MSPKKYYEPSEINPLIPQLETIVQHMSICRTRAEALAGQSNPVRPGDPPADVARQELIRSQVQFLLEAVQDDVAHIERLGGVVKDLYSGLVDFPGQVDGEEVWLCWKQGEPKIGFWHPIDQGFDARQTLPQPTDPVTLH